MKKLRKKHTVLLLIILILSCLLLIVVDEAFARAGGGGGGGSRSSSSHSSSSSRSHSSHSSYSSSRSSSSSSKIEGNLDTDIINLFISCKKNHGFFVALLIFSPLLIFHLITCWALCFYFQEDKLNNKIILILLTIFGSFFYVSLVLTIVIILFSSIFFIHFIGLRIKYGHFINIYEQKEYEMKNIYHLKENSNLKISKETPSKEESALMQIKKNNPAFSLDSFKTRIKNAFRIIQDSWMNRDLSDAEMFLADGTYEQFQIQINGMIEDNNVDIMKDLKILNTCAIKAESTNDYDSIYVTIQAKAINYLMNQKTGAIIIGSKTEPEKFAEVWCFMRRKGTKELNSKGLIEGYCPNCGSHIEGARLIQCPSCSALLKSGQHDWILAGIYQLSEWRDTHNSYIPGLKNLYKYDPAFNIQNIEDKLSAIFWRMIEAIRTRKADPILKISSDKFAQDFIDASCKHQIISNYFRAGIDSIEIKGIFEEEGKHVLLGQVVWNSCPNNDLTKTIHKKSLFILKRSINTKTDIKKCFCSSHCINCGAAETFNSSNYCEYCNTAVNDDTKDWILTDIVNLFSKLAEQYLKQSRLYDKEEVLINQEKKQTDGNKINTETANNTDSTEKNSDDSTKEEYSDDSFDNSYWSLLGKYSVKDLLRMCIAVMLADGKIDENELKIIRKICEIGYIPEQILQMNIREMQSVDNHIDYVLNTSAIELDKDLLNLLIKIAISDGDLAKTEANLIIKLAEKMQISKNETINAINSIYEKKWKKKLDQSIFSQMS